MRHRHASLEKSYRHCDFCYKHSGKLWQLISALHIVPFHIRVPLINQRSSLSLSLSSLNIETLLSSQLPCLRLFESVFLSLQTLYHQCHLYSLFTTRHFPTLSLCLLKSLRVTVVGACRQSYAGLCFDIVGSIIKRPVNLVRQSVNFDP